MKTTWGRDETIVWPPHLPIYSFSAVGLSLLAILLFLWQQTRFAMTPLQSAYIGDYVRSTSGAAIGQHGRYRLIELTGPHAKTRVATPADFNPDGQTTLPSGRVFPASLSFSAQDRGYTTFSRGTERSYRDEVLAKWLRNVVFDSRGLLSTYRLALGEGGLVLLVALSFAGPADVRRLKQLKYGRRLKGPEMLTPVQFNKTLGGDGLGIRTNAAGAILRLPRAAEPKHIQIMGDTGVGKSTLLMQMLQQIEDRGDAAIVYDPAGEFTQRFYRKDRGDWILNPLDARAPYWSPASELRTPAEARTIAASLYQPTNDKKGEFFTETPQKIFAHLLKYRPTPQQLVAWMSDEDEIDKRVKGTELAAFVAKGAQNQRSGVLASLGLVADSLRLLPTREQSDGREWSALDWAEKRQGWIFLTATEAEQDALRPLHSLWIDMLTLRLLTLPKPGQRRAWLVLDELATLQRLPQFHTALTKGRKSDNPIIFCYQGKSQLEVVWGPLAEVLLSQPSTKFVLKTAEPRAAKWASELLGDVEIERVRETVADGRRSGRSFTLDRQTEPLVMSSEIEGLSDLHAFVKLGNYVSRFSFPHMAIPPTVPALVEREQPGIQWLAQPPATPRRPRPGLPLPLDRPPASPVPPALPSTGPARDQITPLITPPRGGAAL